MKNYIFNTYFRILKRDKAKIIVTFLSLLIGAFVLSVVLGLIGSVRTYIFSQSKELIGGDIVLQQSFPIEYEKSKNIGKAFGNVSITDTAQHIIASGNYATYFEKEKKSNALTSLPTSYFYIFVVASCFFLFCFRRGRRNDRLGGLDNR